MRAVTMAGLLSGLLLATGASVAAHHAFAAEFDPARPVHFKGVLQRIEWVNPHSWFHVDVKKPDGTVESWAIEAGTPNVLFRRGITRDTFKIGVEVIVDGYQAKNGSKRANGRDITTADGHKFFLGSSGTGAPYEGGEGQAPR